MSKGLEALEKLYCAGRLDLDYVCSDKHKNDYSIIENELKALEIIKKKHIPKYVIDTFNQDWNLIEVKGKDIT